MNDVYGPGTLAYIDSFTGLVPCRVVSVDRPGEARLVGLTMVTVKVTATRRGWCRGEVTQQMGHDVIPRAKVRVRSGQYRLRCDYSWATAVPVTTEETP